MKLPVSRRRVTIIGAGLAGAEAAWQLAERDFAVTLIEMKDVRRTPAQVSDHLAELVCSNSLRSKNPENAVGLLKEEMRRLNSFIIAQAESHSVPAGDALAVDRERFGKSISQVLKSHPNITFEAREALELPPAACGATIVATGPLTGDKLAKSLAASLGHKSLYFYDAIAPIVVGESIDMSKAFHASRWGKGVGDDYINCPMDEGTYRQFYEALISAESMPLHSFEEAKYFQGCQPVEIIAEQSVDGLRYGPLKPAGLTDPKTGRWPHAVVQLRKEDEGGQAYNMVGFQTKMKWPDQKRVLRMIPGLEEAQFIRMGAIHRNTYLDAPNILDDQLRLHHAPHVRLAGQMTGVEGYVESAATGLLCALMVAAESSGEKLQVPPPTTCALGALYGHLRATHRLKGRAHEPHNVNWSLVPAMPDVRKAQAKKARLVRAVDSFESWARSTKLEIKSRSEFLSQALEKELIPAKKKGTRRPEKTVLKQSEVERSLPATATSL